MNNYVISFSDQGQSNVRMYHLTYLNNCFWSNAHSEILFPISSSKYWFELLGADTT